MDVGIGMLGIAREKCSFHARMRRQPGRDLAGVGALPLHAQRQCLDAAHGQITLERTHHRTDGARKRPQRVEVRLIGDDHAAQHVSVTRPDIWWRCGRRCSRRVPAAAPAAAWRRCCRRSAAHPRRGTARRSCPSRGTRSRGLAMVSTITAPVFSSVRAASKAARSQGSTCAVSTPMGPKMFISMEVVAPYIMLAATTRLGRSIKRGQHRHVDARPFRKRRRSRPRRFRAREPVPRAPNAWDCRSARRTGPDSSSANTRSSCSIDS